MISQAQGKRREANITTTEEEAENAFAMLVIQTQQVVNVTLLS